MNSYVTARADIVTSPTLFNVTNTFLPDCAHLPIHCMKRLYILSDVARATPDTDANCVKFNLADDILSIVGVADCCKRYNCAKSLAILNIGSLDLANENVPNLSKRTPRFCNNWDFITVPIACQTFITISKLIFFVAKLEHT